MNKKNYLQIVSFAICITFIIAGVSLFVKIPKNNNYNELKCSSSELLSDRLQTAITLRCDATNKTELGDVIKIYGQFSPIQSNRRLPLQISIQHPDGTYAYNGIFYTDPSGYYKFNVEVKDTGYMRVEVIFNGDKLYSPCNSEMIIPITTGIGMAIVVAGAGISNPLFPMIEYLSDLAVNTLRRCNIPDETDGLNFNKIWYLHPDTSRDIDNNGKSDVDDLPTTANLEWAIKTWAAELIQTKDSSGNYWAEGVKRTPLTIYLIGDSTNQEFMVKEGDGIDGYTLDIWLDDLEQTIITQFVDAGATPPDYLPINIIVEAPSSGDFIVPVSQMGRVIITSTTAGGYNYMNQAGSVSFSAYFLNCIAGGQYIHPSWSYARYHILSNPTLIGQDPQLESTGNGVANEIADEILTASMPLEERPLTDARPRLLNALGHITLFNIPAAMLWVYVDDLEDSIVEVAATIIPPTKSYEESHTIFLSAHPIVHNRWEGVYDRFYGKGEYTIIYTAVDVSGNTAYAITKTMIVKDSLPPNSPSDFSVFAVYNDTIKLTWSPSESHDTQGYILFYKTPNMKKWKSKNVGNVHQICLSNLGISDYKGNYNFGLTSYDRAGLRSNMVYTLYDTSEYREYYHRPPIANAGEDILQLFKDSGVMLDGSLSSDPVGSTLSYCWFIYGYIPRSNSPVLYHPTIENPVLFWDGYGSYAVKLIVSNPWFSSEADTVVIEVLNLKPVADAGFDQLARVGERAYLDGSNSFDPNYDPLTYQWSIVSKPRGSLAELENPTSTWPNIIVDQVGTYNISLVVFDGKYYSEPSYVAVYGWMDNTPPETVIKIDGIPGNDDWYISDVEITLISKDISGITAKEYSFDETTWFTYTAPFTFTTEGITIIYYRSTDGAGNVETTKSATIKIDKTPPESEVSLDGYLVNNEYYVTDVEVTLSAVDSISGVHHMDFYYGDSEWTTYTEPFTITEHGITTIYYRSVDVAGNIETIKSVIIEIVKSQYTHVIWINPTISSINISQNLCITVMGNLNITETGELHLIDCKLFINNGTTPTYGHSPFGISVYGKMFISDNSTITAIDQSNPFYFIVYEGAIFQMNNSRISYCGHSGGSWLNYQGLTIRTNNVWLENNTITHCYQSILLYYSSYNSILNNNFSYNTYCGIHLYVSQYNTISGNIVEGSINAFYFRYSDYNIITGNIAKNGDQGFRLDISDNNRLLGNSAINNSYLGFAFWYDSNENIFSENTADNNRIGLHVYSSSYNLFYHNNFIENEIQVYAAINDPANNYWYHPDLLEGNYWSDYIGVDDGSGYGKHAIAGDGIGDTDLPWHYDLYPFINENGWI